MMIDRPTLNARMKAKVQVNPDTGCHEWIAGRSSNGYGAFHLNGRNYGAHRVAWELAKGTIPDGLHIDHLCRNRACCNPDHLEPVTPRENILRSPIAPPALNALKNHCPAGHALDGDNLDTSALKSGRRACRECGRKRSRAYHHKNRERRLEAMAKNRALRKDAHQARLDAAQDQAEAA